jgi:hypothetical protein
MDFTLAMWNYYAVGIGTMGTYSSYMVKTLANFSYSIRRAAPKCRPIVPKKIYIQKQAICVCLRIIFAF